MVTLPLSLLTLLSLSLGAFGAEVKITTANELIALSNNVLSGATYAGTTIYLENDIDFTGVSDQFKPIGDSSHEFRGTFDGQGHKISNLVINSNSFRHAGFFGYSLGTTIRNLVLDDTCSISSSKVTIGESNTFSSGIIGCCDALEGSCVLENNVNMAGVSFTGTSGWNMFLGGIASQLYHEGENNIVIRNCINYGAVTFVGTSSLHGHIGGILGAFVESESTAMKYIQNCINYGAITSSGTAKDSTSFIGGIVGISYYPAKVENCVSVGKIAVAASSVTEYTGAILGFAKANGEYLHCHWTDGTGYDRLYGKKEFDSITVTATGSSKITSDAASVNTLNSYGSWNKWVFNTNSAPVTFHTNKGNGYTFASQKLILLPSLVGRTGRTFSGWYTDVTCTNKFNEGSATINSTSGVDLYGGWLYTLTFDGNSGTPSPSSKGVVYGQNYGPLGSATKTGYSFDGWFTSASGGTEIKSSSKVTITTAQTLYAHWEAIQYTVFFKAGNETVAREYYYNETIVYPEDPKREGHMFAGWDKKIVFMPADNVTVTALWDEVSEYVEIVFGTCDLTEEEATKIIEQYAGSNSTFVIVEFKDQSSDEIRVIVKFKDASDGEAFVHTVRIAAREGSGLISDAKFVKESEFSFSTTFYPLFLISTLI